MNIYFGNVSRENEVLAFPRKKRFIAIVDVLGMKKWVTGVGPEVIATEIYATLISYAYSATTGYYTDPSGAKKQIGPSVGTYLFSDSLIVYSCDDSFLSLAILGLFLKTLVSVALNRGIPLRGAIALGEMVINRRLGIFVGLPLAEADEYDKHCEYRGVGIRMAPATLALLQDRARNSELESNLSEYVTQDFLLGRDSQTNTLIWFRDAVFINHWDATFMAGNPRDLLEEGILELSRRFRKRGLIEDDEVRKKLHQTEEFLAYRVKLLMEEADDRSRDFFERKKFEEKFEETQSFFRDLITLDQIGLQDYSDPPR